MKENTRETKLKYIFGSHPEAKEFHVTSDDQAFKSANDAANHAATLEDKTVEIVKRQDYIKNEKTEFNQSDMEAAEREKLIEKHKVLFGNRPASNAGLEKLKAKVSAEEARLSELDSKESEGDASEEEE